MQVFHLEQAKISSGYLSAQQEYWQQREILDGLKANPPTIKILFVTPEKVCFCALLCNT